MNIKNIRMGSMGSGHFNTEYAIIETNDGKYYQYEMEFERGHRSEVDYFTNASHDFYKDFQSGLFSEIKDDDYLDYWHEQWIIDAVRKAEQ